jgi:hypothetical protein
MRLAPTPEHKADTLYHLALIYEGGADRENTIATYKRILDEYPESGHVPRCLYRLGELYSSVTFIEPNASEERVEQVLSEMSDEVSLEYFAQGEKIPLPYDPDVMGCKMAAGNRHAVLGRRSERRKRLDELAVMNEDDVDVPIYVGPYDRILSHGYTIGDPLENAKAVVRRMRTVARRRLVECSVIHGHPVESISNLEKLIDEYPDSDISKAAAKEIERLSGEMLKGGRDETPPIETEDLETPS